MWFHKENLSTQSCQLCVIMDIWSKKKSVFLLVEDNKVLYNYTENEV